MKRTSTRRTSCHQEKVLSKQEIKQEEAELDVLKTENERLELDAKARTSFIEQIVTSPLILVITLVAITIYLLSN